MKSFKKYVVDNLPGVILYKPQNQKECDETIELILKSRKKQLEKNIPNDKQKNGLNGALLVGVLSNIKNLLKYITSTELNVIKMKFKDTSWELTFGLYPGVLIGMRTYTNKESDMHVLYLPFVDLCLEIFK